MLLNNLIKKINLNEFTRSVTNLSLGTVVSQLIVISIYPLTTRLYNVDVFGEFSLFTSIAALLIIFSTGRFENAFIQIGNHRKYEKLLSLILLTALVCFLLYLLILVFIKEILKISGFSSIFYLLPFYTAIIAIYTGLGSYHERKLNYKFISQVFIVQAITTGIFSLILGYFRFFYNGLVIAATLGGLAGVLFLYIRAKGIRFKLNWKESSELVNEFKNIPKYLIPTDFSNALSLNFIPFIIASSFSLESVGSYALASRIMRVPNLLVANAIGSVFKNHAIEEFKELGNCTGLYKWTLNKFVVLLFPAYLFFIFFSPSVFVWLFGESWLLAGQLASVLAISAFAEFIFAALRNVFIITDNNRSLLIFQIVNVLLGFTSLVIGILFLKSITNVILAYSILNALSLSCAIIYGYNLTKKN